MSASWPAKDPDSVLDYRYDVPLDEGDTIATVTLERLSGTVNIDGQASDATGITAWLSGGTDGETALFRVYWTTIGGRKGDDTIALPVAQGGVDVVAFKLRYPALATATSAQIGYWLKDAKRIVTSSWGEDEKPAAFAFAAHGLAKAGVGASGATQIPAGVTRFRSGSFDVSVSEAAANAARNGGYDSTPYGQEFLTFLRRNRGGARLVSC